MFFDILIVILASTGVVLLLKYLLEFLLMPKKVEGCSMFVVVSVSGEVPELESVIRSAKWLAQRNSAEFLLIDSGMESQTRAVGEKLAVDIGYKLLNTDEAVNGWIR